MIADQPTLNSAVLAQFSIFFQLTLPKHLCLPLSALGLIIVICSSQAALNIFLKNYKTSRTQLQDSSSKLTNEIMFHPFSELFTGCPSKHISSISCQHSVTPLSLIQPLFYLSDLLNVSSPSRQLHSSSDSRTPCIPHKKTKTFGHRSFSHAAPSVWNSLPHNIRPIQSVIAFKTALKTHLFKSYLC